MFFGSQVWVMQVDFYIWTRAEKNISSSNMSSTNPSFNGFRSFYFYITWLSSNSIRFWWPHFFWDPIWPKNLDQKTKDFPISTVWNDETNKTWISVVATTHLEELLASGRTNAPWCNVQDLHSWPCRARISKISNRFPIRNTRNFQVPYKHTISVRTCVFLKQLFVDTLNRLRTPPWSTPPSARWLHANRQNVGELCTKPGAL